MNYGLNEDGDFFLFIRGENEMKRNGHFAGYVTQRVHKKGTKVFFRFLIFTS